MYRIRKPAAFGTKSEDAGWFCEYREYAIIYMDLNDLNPLKSKYLCCKIKDVVQIRYTPLFGFYGVKIVRGSSDFLYPFFQHFAKVLYGFVNVPQNLSLNQYILYIEMVIKTHG